MGERIEFRCLDGWNVPIGKKTSEIATKKNIWDDFFLDDGRLREIEAGKHVLIVSIVCIARVATRRFTI